jgi:ATP-binding cassette subfamily B protein
MLPVTTLTINVSSVALIWFGGLRIDRGQMQVGSLTAFLAYFTQILMAVLMATMTLVGAASSVRERRANHRGAVTHAAIDNPPSPQIQRRDHRRSAHGRRRIHLSGADRPVLQDISLTALPGTTTAVVGSTGSGKSTLVSLICRLCDVTAGAVLIDDVDVRDYHTERLWSAIGLVPQRGYLFSGTVADNLRIGAAPGQVISDEEMWEALQWPPLTDSCGETTTGCTCTSPRVESTSPVGNGSGLSSPAQSSAARPSICSTTRSPRSMHTPTRRFAPRSARYPEKPQ